MRTSKLGVVCMVIAATGCVTPGDESIDPDDDGPIQTSGGGGASSGTSTGSGSTTSSGLRVFTTHGAYSGNLMAYLGSATNGLAAGDAICQLRADSVQLGGKWRAWLSSSQINAIDRVSGQGPWKLVVGNAIVFQQRAQLQTEPTYDLNRDEHGEVIEDDCYGCTRVRVWTGTQAGGVHGADTCGEWTATDGYGLYGIAREGSFEWTAYGTSECTDLKHLVCLEQAL